MPSDPRELTVEQYRAAFLELEPVLTAKQRELLQLHYAAPGHKRTEKQLARSVGWKRYTAVGLQYGRMAHKIGEMYGVRLPKDWVWMGVLASLAHPAREWEFTLRPQVVQALEELGWVAADPLADIEQFEAGHPDLDQTTRKQIVDSRLGQGWFRAQVVAYWQRCAVTGCSTIEVLRASHIKPWRDCTNRERLDANNGLLLVPNLDSLFDRGLVTFDDDGLMAVSAALDIGSRQLLGITDGVRIKRLTPKHREYLRYHRDRVFRP